MTPTTEQGHKNHNNGPEQLSLLTEAELTSLQLLSASRLQTDETPPFEADGVRKAGHPKAEVIQDKLPGF